MGSWRILRRVGTSGMKWVAVLSLVTAMALAGFGRGHSIGKPAFTIEQMVNIKFPGEPVWSPDGHHMAFMWDEGGVYSLYVVSAGGDDAPLKLMTYPWSEVSSQGSVPPALWSHDGATLYYPQWSGCPVSRRRVGLAMRIWSSPSVQIPI